MTTEKSAAQQFAYLQRLKVQEAADYLKGRGKLTQTYSWQDLWHEEHGQQFTVSRLTRLDILKAMQDGITQSVDGDLSRRDWMRDIKALLKKEGWWGEVQVLDPATGETVSTKFDSARLKLIFDTNTRMAYSAGDWERIWRNRETHPYVRYITKNDERVRATHRVWNNLVLPADDPFWATHWPPNAWRCRCRVVSLTQAEYDKGYSETRAPYEYNPDGTVKRIPPIERVPFNKEAPPERFVEWTNKRTGESSQVPAGISPGFDYNPGLARTRQAGLEKVAREKLAAAPEPLAKAAAEAGIGPVVARFVEAKTAKAAAEYAVKNNMADYADYTDVKPEVANAFNRSLFDHLEEFPGLRKNQRFVGSAQGQFEHYATVRRAKYVDHLVNHGLTRDVAEAVARERVKKPRIKGNRFAQSWKQPEAQGIAVNAKWGATPEALKAKLAELELAGWFPPGCNTFRSIVDHEIGHQLDDLLDLRLDPDVVLAYKEARSKGMRTEVSGYAESNGAPIEEFIAECWSESCNNPAPRDAARSVAAIVRARYRAKFNS